MLSPLLSTVNSLLSSHRLLKRSPPTCPGAFQDGKHAHTWCFRMLTLAMGVMGVLACIVGVARAASKHHITEQRIVNRMVRTDSRNLAVGLGVWGDGSGQQNFGNSKSHG